MPKLKILPPRPPPPPEPQLPKKKKKKKRTAFDFEATVALQLPISPNLEPDYLLLEHIDDHPLPPEFGLTMPATPEDTIKVARNRMGTVDMTESDADSPLSSLDGKGTSPDVSANTGKRDMEKKDDQSSDDFEMLDADDSVEEYDFSNEPDDEEEEEDDHVHDTAYYKYPDGAMPLSDDEDDDREDRNAISLPDERPWKGFDLQARGSYESMFCNIPTEPMNGSWEYTEDYQREKDKVMHRYVEDFPIPQWVISQQQATHAYDQLLQRTRWRGLGIRIFGPRAPEFSSGVPQQPFQSTQMAGNQQRYQPQQTQRGSQFIGPQQASLHAPPQRVPPEISRNMSQQMPPQQVLRSQPNAQPVPTRPNGLPIHQPTGYPGVRGSAPPQVMRVNAIPAEPIHPQTAHQMSPGLEGSKGKARMPKPTSPIQDVSSPVPGVPIPPYQLREKPIERKVTKSGRTLNKRKHAEADEFPWNRQLDFIKARAEASWDDSIYPQSTLDDMAVTRSINESFIEKIDAEETERQRVQRVDKRKRKEEGGPGSDEPTRTRTRKKAPSMEPKDEEGGSNDYHSGSFCFATQDDVNRAAAVGRKTPDDIMIDAKTGELSLNACAQIFICWNPGKKGVSEALTQAKFSVRDLLLTREQLKKTPVLTRRAAECIVDFCPDMLFRGMLLRIASEAGYGNKEVRDRMAHNGNYADKATITKRIGAALGQKQRQAPSRKKKGDGSSSTPADVEPEVMIVKDTGYAEGEGDYYNVNVQDFSNYVDFFGKRTSQRGQLKLQPVGVKRKHSLVGMSEGSKAGTGMTLRQHAEAINIDSDGTEAATSPSDEVTTGESSEVEVESDEVEGGGEDGEEAMGERADDEVSVQSDTILDAMDED